MTTRIRDLARENDKKRFQRDYVWLKEGIKAEEIGRACREFRKDLDKIMNDTGYNLISKKYGNS